MGARALIACCLLLAACGGPQPEVEPASITVTSVQPGFQRVQADVRNASGGHGQIAIDITLRGTTGQVIEETRTVQLRAHEQIRFAADIAAPPGTYTAELDATYPD